MVKTQSINMYRFCELVQVQSSRCSSARSYNKNISQTIHILCGDGLSITRLSQGPPLWNVLYHGLSGLPLPKEIHIIGADDADDIAATVVVKEISQIRGLCKHA